MYQYQAQTQPQAAPHLQPDSMILNQQLNPCDTISNLKWLGNGYFYYTSWDGTLAVCQLVNWDCQGVFKKECNSPITASVYLKGLDQFALCFLNKQVILLQLNNQQEQLLFSTEDFVSQVEQTNNPNIILFFQTHCIQIFDLRNQQTRKLQYEFDHIHSHVVGDFILSGFTHKKISFYTVDNLLQSSQIVYRPVNCIIQINRVFLGDCNRFFYLGDVTGRVHMYDNHKSQLQSRDEKEFITTFLINKRIEEGNQYTVHPVEHLEEIMFNQTQFLFTVSSVGQVAVWNMQGKSKTLAFEMQSNVTNVDIDFQSGLIINARGYNWQQGIMELSELKITPGIQIQAVDLLNMIANAK